MHKIDAIQADATKRPGQLERELATASALMAGSREREKPNIGYCAVCGHEYHYVWTRTGCCSDSCAGTLRRWRARGIPRAKARISTYQARIAEMQRIIAAIDAWHARNLIDK